MSMLGRTPGRDRWTVLMRLGAVALFVGVGTAPFGAVHQRPLEASSGMAPRVAHVDQQAGGGARVYLPALSPDPNAPPPIASRVLAVPGDYATVAAALAVARAGDVVQVAKGRYVESGLRVPADVTLRGVGWISEESAGRSLISNEDGAPYTVSLGPGARIEGFEIESDESNLDAVGILVEGAGRRTIRDVFVTQHGTAIAARCAQRDCGLILELSDSLLVPNRADTVGIDADAASRVLVDHVTIGNAQTAAKLHGAGSRLTNSIIVTGFDGSTSTGLDARQTGGDVEAHHNLFWGAGTPYIGIEPGAGDVLADPLLMAMGPQTWRPSALSPARGAAEDGSDLGVLPFVGSGVPPTNLRVEAGTPHADGRPMPWMLAFDPVPDAYIYHAFATRVGGGPTVLSYAYAGSATPDDGPPVALEGLEPGMTYDLTVSTVYREGGESEAAEPIAFIVPAPSTVLEDDDPLLTTTGSWRPVTAAGASGGHYIASSAEGDTLSFAFSGDSVAIQRMLGPDGGQANVQIDGNSQGVLEFYFQEARLGIPAIYDNLGDGPHALTLRVLSTAQSAARGHRVTFDRADAPSGHVPDAIQRAARDRVNAIRGMAGLGAVHQAGALDLAAAGHAAWDMRNGFAVGHVEAPGTPGFIGARSWHRAPYFGYTPDVGEDMAFEWGTVYTPEDTHYGPGAVDGWQATVYHRNLIMAYSYVDMGFGYNFEEDRANGVLLMGTRGGGGPLPGTRYAYTWPIDGQTDVPRGWDGNEGPDPLPQRDDEVGYPVSLYLAQPPRAPGAARADVDEPLREALGLLLRPIAGAAILGAGSPDRPSRADQATPWRVTRAELRDAGGAVVRTYAIDQKNDAPKFLGPDVVFLIAEQPMAARARYTASVAGTDSRGAAFDETWAFTTGD